MLRFLAPVSLTLVLVAWTVAVAPVSRYGDVWAILPAVAVLPVVVVWHARLVWRARYQRQRALLIALLHGAILLPLWLMCLMQIAKDSL